MRVELSALFADSSKAGLEKLRVNNAKPFYIVWKRVCQWSGREFVSILWVQLESVNILSTIVVLWLHRLPRISDNLSYCAPDGSAS